MVLSQLIKSFLRAPFFPSAFLPGMPSRAPLSFYRRRWNQLLQSKYRGVQLIFLKKSTDFIVPPLLLDFQVYFNFPFHWPFNLRSGWLLASQCPTVGCEWQYRTWWFFPYIFELLIHSWLEFRCTFRDRPFQNVWTFFEVLWTGEWFVCIRQWGFCFVTWKIGRLGHIILVNFLIWCWGYVIFF